MADVPAPQRLTGLREQFTALSANVDADALAARVGELEQQMGAPGFWDDQETRGEGVGRARAGHAPAGGVPLAGGRDRGPRGARRARRRGRVDRRRARRRSSTRWSSAWPSSSSSGCSPGRYDAGDALVTVNAGAGGTDAQDWAEMVLRMEMRWAEARGFKVELLEASAGEEAGIKSATFRVGGRERLRPVLRREGRPPARAASARSTPPTAARRASPGVEVAPVIEDAGEVEIDSDDLQVDTYRASGAGGQHVNKTDSAVRITHRPSGSSCSARTSARRRRTARPR